MICDREFTLTNNGERGKAPIQCEDPQQRIPVKMVQ